MPMVEVLYVKDEPLSIERKRAFVEKAVSIFREELGTPPARLRLTFQQVAPEDSKVGLVDEVEGGDCIEDESDGHLTLDEEGV